MTLNFFVLAGDANQDRQVNVGDLGALATNYGGSNKTYSQGDFNYDTIVNVGDLGILATNYGASLGAGSGGSTLMEARSTAPVANASPAAAVTPFSDVAWDSAHRQRDLLRGAALD
jgi:hypothetical protein